MATISEIKVRGNNRKIRDAQAWLDIDGISGLFDGSDNLLDPMPSAWGQVHAYDIMLDKKYQAKNEKLYLAAFYKSGWNPSATGGICIRIYNSSDAEIGSFWFYKQYTEPKSINIKSTYSAASYFKITVNTNDGGIGITPQAMNGAIEGYVGYRTLNTLNDAYPLYRFYDGVTEENGILTDNLFDKNPDEWQQGNYESGSYQYCVTTKKSFTAQNKDLFVAVIRKDGFPSNSGGAVIRVFNSSNTLLGSIWCYDEQTLSRNLITVYPTASYFKIEVNSNQQDAYIRPEKIESIIDCYVGYTQITSAYSILPQRAIQADKYQNQRLDELEKYSWTILQTDNLFDPWKENWKQGDYGTDRQYSVITKEDFTAENKTLYCACAYLDGWNENATGGMCIRVYDSSHNVLGSLWVYDKRQRSINILETYPTAATFRIEINTNAAGIAIYPESVHTAISCYVGYTAISSWMDIVPKYVLGSLVDVYQDMRLDSLEEGMQDSYIPTFYKEYMAQRIKTLNTLDTTIGNHGDAFVFITDMHDQNNYYSPAMAKKITRDSSVRMIVYGGDYINEPGTKAGAIESLTSHRNKMTVTNDVYIVRGNHDTNPYGGTGTQLTKDEYYGICDKYLEQKTDTKGQTYFYRDNETQKIRYFFLDSESDGTVDSTQQAWLAAKLAELDSSWHVVVFIHYGIYPAVEMERDAIETYGCLTTVKGILADATATICCVVCGHVHIDISDTSGSYPIIAVTCDAHGIQASGSSNDDRTEGTVNEQAFDVFHIDTTAKKIYVTRFGGGENDVTEGSDLTLNDREFTYS